MRLGTAYIVVKANLKDLKPGFDSAKSMTSSASKHMADSFKSVKSSVFSLQSAVIGIAGGYGMGSLAKSFYTTGLQVDSLDRSLQAAIGSSKEAEKVQKFLRIESERLGLVLRDSIQSYKQFAAAAKGTSIEGDQTKEIFLGIAEASTALKLTSDDTQGAMRALTQIMSKGKVQAEELRGQLGERIPSAFQIASRAMGMTTAELSKQLELGEIYSDVFLPKFARELRKTYGKDAVAASDSLQASINKLQNTWFELQSTVMKSGITDELAKSLKTINEELKIWLDNNQELIAQKVPEYMNTLKDSAKGFYENLKEISEWWTSLPEPLKNLIIGGAIGGKVAGVKGAVFGGIGYALQQLGSDASNSLEAQKKTLESLIASSRAIGSNGLAEKYTKQLEEVNRQLSIANGYTDALGYGMQFVTDETKKATKEAEKFVSAISDAKEYTFKELAQFQVSAANTGLDSWRIKAMDEDEVEKRAKVYEEMIKEEEKQIEQFNDAYNQATMSRFEYEKSVLQKQAQEWEDQGQDRIKIQQIVKARMLELEKEYADETGNYTRVMLESMQSHFADTINDMFDGGLNSGIRFFDTLKDIAKRTYSEMMAKEIMVKIKPVFEGIVEDINKGLNKSNIQKGSPGYVDYSGYAMSSLAVYGMAASSEGGQRTGTMAGAAVGGIGAYMAAGSSAGPYGMIVGAIVGGIIGAMSDDDTPSWFDLYMEKLDALTKTMEQNNRALEAQLNATNSWADRFQEAKEAKIYNQELIGAPDKGTTNISSYAEFEALRNEYGTFENYYSAYSEAMRNNTTPPQTIVKGPVQGNVDSKAWWSYYDQIQTGKYTEFTSKMKLILGDIDTELKGWANSIGYGIPSTFGDAGGSWDGKSDQPVPKTEKEKALAEGYDTYKNLIEGLKDFKDSWDFGGEDWGAELVDQRIAKVEEIRDAWLESIEADFSQKRIDVFKDIDLYLNQYTGEMSSIQIAIDNTETAFDKFIESLTQAGASAQEIAEADQKKLAAMQETATASFKNLLKSIDEYTVARIRADWGVDEWSDHFSDLSEQIGSLNKESVTYYDDALDLYSQQFGTLQNILSITEQQAGQYQQVVDSLDSAIWNLSGGSLAAVQSSAGMQNRYDELLSLARSGDASAASEFANFAQGEFLSFMAASGTDYKTLTGGIISDLETTKQFYMDEIDYLKSIELNTKDTANYTYSMKQDLILAIGAMSAAISDDVKNQFLQESLSGGTIGPLTRIDVERNSDLSKHLINVEKMTGASFDMMKNFIYSFMDNPGSHPMTLQYNGLDGQIHGLTMSGGLDKYTVEMFGDGGLTGGVSIAGEKGSEWILPTYEPQRRNFLRDAGVEELISKIGSMNTSGEKEVTINIYVDPDGIGNVVAKQFRTNGQLVESARRVIR